MIEKIAGLLPGANCGKCGYARCELFAEALLFKKASLQSCSLFQQDRFKENLDRVRTLLLEDGNPARDEPAFQGLIDNYRAEYILHPPDGEPACRETLVPFANIQILKGDTIRYRPLGCPIMHVADVLSSELGMITVHVKGPRRKETPYEKTINLGVCLIIGFSGILQGRNFEIGDTIRFIPGHCMMQKVHSGIVVQAEDKRVHIELIDLKVWELPEKVAPCCQRAVCEY